MKIKEKIFFSAMCFFLKPSFLMASEFSISDPSKGLFDKDTKVAQLMFTSEWLVKAGAGLFAITCFIGAGNMARQGQYGRAFGAVVGGVISSIGAYLVSLSQH